jgi:hypothetical protein
LKPVQQAQVFTGAMHDFFDALVFKQQVKAIQVKRREGVDQVTNGGRCYLDQAQCDAIGVPVAVKLEVKSNRWLGIQIPEAIR